LPQGPADSTIGNKRWRAAVEADIARLTGKIPLATAPDLSAAARSGKPVADGSSVTAVPAANPSHTIAVTLQQPRAGVKS
jgi:hypothetical protein